MSERSLVSVIIPVFNSGKYLEDTLNSVADQTHAELEVIIVDDGSSDSSPEVIRKFTERDARFKGIVQGNKGVSAARNTGYRASSGEYLAFLDGDDIWRDSNIEVKLKKLEGSDWGLVHSDAAVVDSEGIPTGEVLTGKEGELLSDLLCWNGTCIPGPSSILIPRTVFEEAGPFDEELSTAADLDLFIRIAASHRVGRVAEVTWEYRIHGENMHKDIQRMERDVLRVFRKAQDSGFLNDKKMRRQAWSTTLRVLGASWIGDGGSWWRGTKYILRSLLVKPSSFGTVLSRSVRKWKS